ncbi:MAG TPA: hypothetical protein VLE53_17555, partial [Gemmatimonadaceae bacterium]|nr:hypothetical protein [Gemmatimonadaceae bacterium]
MRPCAGRALLLVLALPLTQAWAQTATANPPSGTGATAQASATAKKPLTVADYSRWRNIEGAEISGDGRWVTYTLRHSNTLPAESKPVLRILNLDTSQEVEVPNAHDGTFSPDSRWIVYQIDSVPAPRGRGGRGGTPGTDTSAAPPPAPNVPATPGAPAVQGAAGRGAAPAATPPRMELRELATG